MSSRKETTMPQGSLAKTAVITGGTRGIGAAIASAFHATGYSVVLAARNDNGLAGELGERAYFLKTDVASEKAHQKLVELALKKTGRLDVYINCAGLSGWKPLAAIDDDFLQEMIDVNLKGSFWGCKAASKVLPAGGSIINVASLAGKRGSANNAAYCAAKFGVVGLTQALAKELGPRGIRVNAVCPVYVITEGVVEALRAQGSPAGGRKVQDYLAEFARTQSALGRLPTAQEVAYTCLFLTSEAATAITGQSINVDCGVLPQ
jgi:3-oxoacyl-[acyl-carrier protein] reductase/meso-butanediol dehydrogenase/(S,S)-butanediol dehydrogenase/diacetyl reductase